MVEPLDDAFLAVMATTPAPVAIVTTMLDGQPFGTTVSAFSSLSRRPPMVLTALDNNSQTLAKIAESGRFGVNLLAADQAELALGFAMGTGDRFAGVEWTSYDGLPRLAGGAAWLSCEVDRLVGGGDHQIVLGLVTEATLHEARPMVYSRRQFGSHRPAHRTGHPLPPENFPVDAHQHDVLNFHALSLLGLG